MVDVRHMINLSEPIPWNSSLLWTDSEDDDSSDESEVESETENEDNQIVEESMIKTLFISRVINPKHYPIQR